MVAGLRPELEVLRRRFWQVGLTPEVGGRPSRLNHALRCVVTARSQAVMACGQKAGLARDLYAPNTLRHHRDGQLEVLPVHSAHLQVDFWAFLQQIRCRHLSRALSDAMSR
jgi:hypothetical protein